MSFRRLYFIALAALVIGGHIALFASDRVPFETALRFALTNAAIWALVLAPLLLLRALRRRPRGDTGDGT